MFSFFIEPFDISFIKSSSQVCQKKKKQKQKKNVEHTVK